MKNDNKGFSLIELIVVIAIMAILVGAMAPQVTKYIEKSRKASDVQALGTMYTALVTTLADPDATGKPKSGTVTIGSNGAATAETAGIATTDVIKTMGISAITDFKLSSNAYKKDGNTITITIDEALGSVVISVPDKVDTGKTLKIDASGSHVS